MHRPPTIAFIVVVFASLVAGITVTLTANALLDAILR